ncbi:transposase [Streptomyces parvus]|uniref:transposase n=1 Tax=Streptomyces parvus TaxID=66428 RepID=UPI0035D79061
MSTWPWIVDDDLWALIEPLLPPRPVLDRLCLQGVLLVLHNDMAWQFLLLEAGFGSRQTRWRRLDRWQKAGAFDQLHQVLLTELNVPADSTGHVRARMAPNIRAKQGIRLRSSAGRPAEDGQQKPPDLRRMRHPAQGLTAFANVNDVTQTLALVDRIPPGGRAARSGHAAGLMPCSATRATTSIQPEPGRAT